MGFRYGWGVSFGGMGFKNVLWDCILLMVVMMHSMFMLFA